MDNKKEAKIIDYSKINIGVELECFILKEDSFENASKEDSQKIFKTLIKKFGWEIKKNHDDEIQAVTKKIDIYPVDIKLDLSYAIFEIAGAVPAPNLETLEKLNEAALDDLRLSLNENGLMIWPFGVAPASTGFLKTLSKTKEEIVNDGFYSLIQKYDNMLRLCHITSHQVNIDIAFPKLLPAINAFYKNLGNIIEKFATCAVYADNMLYKEGRYYWWLDAGSRLKKWRIPTFPEKEFQTWNDFYTWIFNGSGILIRNNIPYGFKNGTAYDNGHTNIHDLLKERKIAGIDPDGNDIELKLQKEDIDLLIHMNWLDFKPHFDLDLSYTLEEFLNYYDKKDMDGFLEKYCQHCWLEIRPCSPHLEENAMVLPRYFYDIVMNLDRYIEGAKKISWEEARIARDRAIGYIN